MKWLDRGTLMLLLGAVILIAYIESRGGFRSFSASRSWDRKAAISVPTTPDGHGEPNSTSPSFPELDGLALFANPIAAAEGSNGTIIALMSATSGGAVKISAEQMASPEYDGRLYRDPDKGLLFVALPSRVSKGNPPSHGDAGSTLPSNSFGIVDVARYYRSLIASKQAPRSFPVSA